MGTRWIPGWLYEILPYCYMAIGLIVLISLRNFPGAFSGVLLIAAGFFIWNQRNYYRAKLRREAEKKTEVAPEKRQQATIQITWQPSYEVGNEVIDRQHRRLFALGNEVLNAVMSKQPKGDIELMMDELVTDIAEHFSSEEEIMDSHGHPLSDSHKDIHANLLERVKDMRTRFSRDQLPAGELIGFITYDVIAQHITKEDLKFAAQ